jgi:hypothetical protein
MANSTRSALLRDGCVAIGAATLISFNLPEVARAESESASVFHVFAFQWKQGTSKLKRTEPRKRFPLSKG